MDYAQGTRLQHRASCRAAGPQYHRTRQQFPVENCLSKRKRLARTLESIDADRPCSESNTRGPVYTYCPELTKIRRGSPERRPRLPSGRSQLLLIIVFWSDKHTIRHLRSTSSRIPQSPTKDPMTLRASRYFYKIYRYPLHLSPFSLFARTPLSFVNLSTVFGTPTSRKEINR